MEKKLLSICIPTYNRGKIVYENVNNLLKNNYDFFEVVVTDNCSDDETQRLLGGVTDCRFRYIRNEQQLGYTNLAQCVFNARGKYALLLSDEDDLYNVNWDSIRDKLSKENMAAIISVNYYDEEGKILFSRLEDKKENSSIDATMWALTCRYCGGLIFNTEIVHLVWDEIDKESAIWTTFYPQTILTLACVQKGYSMGIDCLSVRRSPRDGTGTDNLEFKKGKTDREPYWSYVSREWQNKDFLKIIYNMNIDKETKIQIMYNIRMAAMGAVLEYYNLIHNDSLYTEIEELRKFYYICQRDLKKSTSEWIVILFQNDKTMKKEMMRLVKEGNDIIPIKKRLAFLKGEFECLFYCMNKILKNKKKVDAI